MQCEIRYTADQERIQNRARHNVAGIFHLVTDVTDVVVSEIVVDGNQSRAAEAEYKAPTKGHCSGRKIEGFVSIKVGKAGDDHRQHRQHGPDPKGECYFAQEGDLSAPKEQSNEASGY